MAKMKLSAAFAFLKLKIPSVAELNENNLEPAVIRRTIEESGVAIETEIRDELETVILCENEYTEPCGVCGLAEPPKGIPPKDGTG